MVYCQECGSEITNVDSFCPFCGISLPSKNIANNAESENIESQDKLADENQSTISDSEIELTSDDLKDEKDEEIDMSETIVVDHSALVTDNDKSNDSGYIDIKTLKPIEESSAAEFEEVVEELPEEIEEPQSSGLELGSAELTKEDISNQPVDLDISDNQDDIEKLLIDDETDSSEDLDNLKDDSQILSNSKNIEPILTSIVSETDEQTNGEEKVVEVITDAVSEQNDVSNNESEEISDTDGEAGIEFSKDKIETINQNEEVAESDFIDSSSLKENTDISGESASEQVADSFDDSAKEEAKIHNTPTEIQTAADSEIDEAVSVIDSKALAWKENEESLTTEKTESEDKKHEEMAENNSVIRKDEKVFESDETSVDEPISNMANSSDESVESELELPISSEVIEEKTEENDFLTPVVQGEEVSLDEVIKASNDIEIEPTNSTEIQDLSSDESGLNEANSNNTEVEEVNFEEEKPATVSSQTTPNIGVGDTDGSKSKKLKPLDKGVVLNSRYEIVRKIGGGGMGAVYLANDRNLGGVLRAVKEMVQSYIEEEQQEKAIQDFKRESMILTTLDHSSIPTIYDYFYDEGEARFYLVMKYISGGDLSARLRAAPEGKLDEVSVTDWALQIADVLDYLHSKNPPIVYRDLKPANIMIDGNSDKVMLIDFGIARSINKEEKGVTAVGTMGYAPPELFSGNVEPSSDIYSLGSTMFHLLTGADPQNNPLLIFDFQKHPRPRQINPQLSDQMERILMRAVEYNAERRFSSAAEMRNSLTEHLENLKKGSVSFGIKETPTAVALSDQPVFCGFCGQKIVATDMFCAFCGAKQPLAQPGVHSQEYHLPQTTAKLVIDGTSELDYKPFELVKNENLVGRRDPMSNIFPEIDLSKYDPQTKISRKHARIWREGDNFLLEDLGSSNGTVFISTLNDRMKLMPNQKQVLQNGDKIQVGDTTLQFTVE